MRKDNRRDSLERDERVGNTVEAGKMMSRDEEKKKE